MKKPEGLICCDKLTTGYGKHAVSKELTLRATSKKLVMVMGPNGCGKSTLMRTIAGLQKPLEGSVQILGKDVFGLSLKERARLLSLVLTDRFDVANLTVHDIVSIGRYPYVGYRGVLRHEDKQVVAESIEKCNLRGFENRLFSEMSDGEKQRTMVARALAQKTPVMLLDEPTAHLDLPGRMEIIMMLRELADKSNLSIIITTHELDLTLQWGDHVWLMNRDGAVRTGAPEDLVLGGDFGHVFGNEKISFDTMKGQFFVSKPYRGKVHICGQGNRLEWTKRALMRIGFEPVVEHTTPISISVLPNCWIVTSNNDQQRIDTLSETIDYFHKVCLSANENENRL